MHTALVNGGIPGNILKHSALTVSAITATKEIFKKDLTVGFDNGTNGRLVMETILNSTFT